MKRIAISLLIVIGQIMACSSDNNEAELSAKQAALQDSLDQIVEQENMIRAVSAQLIGEFSSNLNIRLTTAIQTGGPSGAISECGLAASQVAEFLSQHGWSIRRVSDRNRNQDNRATLAEKNIMTVFTDTTQPIRKFFGDWKTVDSVETYTYYKPIWARKFCLKCHGDMQTLASGVYQTIKKHYPMDKATGYKAGDLRGMFVVEAVWPDGKEFATRLLAGEAIDSLLADTTELADTTFADSALVDSTK